MGEESIIVIAAIDKIARLIAANAAKSQVTVRSGSQTTRVLGYSGSQKRQISVAAAVQRKFIDGALVNQRRHRAGLGFHQRLLARNRDNFLRPCNRQLEFEITHSADLDPQIGRDLRRHPGGFSAGRVFAGRKQIECETALGVGDYAISDASRGVYQSDRCAVNPPARRIKYRAANRSSGGILGQSSCDEQENHADEAWHRADTWKWIKVSPDRGELGLYITDEAGRSVTARLFFSIRSRIGKLGRSDQYVLQLSVFRLCFLQNGDIRFSIFPKCKKVLIGFAALGRVAGESVSSCQAHVRKCISGSYRS